MYKDYKLNNGSSTTHTIGRFGLEKEYSGIIVPFTRTDGGVNIILFYANSMRLKIKE